MRRRFPKWVIAGETLFYRDAWQFGRRNLDPSHFVPAEIVAYHDRDERVSATDLTENATTIHVAKLDQGSQGVERRADVCGLLADDDKMIVLAVVGKGRPEPVKDAPAGWRN